MSQVFAYVLLALSARAKFPPLQLACRPAAQVDFAAVRERFHGWGMDGRVL